VALGEKEDGGKKKKVLKDGVWCRPWKKCVMLRKGLKGGKKGEGCQFPAEDTLPGTTPPDEPNDKKRLTGGKLQKRGDSKTKS